MQLTIQTSINVITFRRGGGPDVTLPPERPKRTVDVHYGRPSVPVAFHPGKTCRLDIEGAPSIYVVDAGIVPQLSARAVLLQQVARGSAAHLGWYPLGGENYADEIYLREDAGEHFDLGAMPSSHRDLLIAVTDDQAWFAGIEGTSSGTPGPRIKVWF